LSEKSIWPFHLGFDIVFASGDSASDETKGREKPKKVQMMIAIFGSIAMSIGVSDKFR
jgi:hypothetical protein